MNTHDPRDSYIAQVVQGRSFLEVGGLWGGVNEKVSVAYRFGARRLAIVDVAKPENQWWEFFRQRMTQMDIKNYDAYYEVTDELIKLKKPYFVVSYDFEFERFPEKVDLAIAHSLFTHLPPRLIHKCLKNFLVKAKGQTILFATFFETNKTVKNPPKPGDHKSFLYTREEMVYFGEANGYSSQYIGQWGHPRGQVMVAYSPR
ncbi:MAG: hypothetical protein Q6L55_06400 [Gloeomargarita sp. SRBZ-1_bins_9]